MSLIGVHAGFAATITTLFLARSNLTRTQRWSIIIVSAFWAIVPDAYHVVPSIKSWYKPLIHDSIVANVFWFHRVFDRLNPGDQPIYSITMITIFLIVFSLVELVAHHKSHRHSPL